MELGDNIVILKNVKGDPIMSKGINSRKVAVIGTGFVGSSSAFALMESGLFTEMVLIDADKNRAEGEALDIAHGLPFARPMKITAGDYDDIVDAAIIVVTAGAGQKPGETRLDLVKKNVAIFQSIIPEILRFGKNKMENMPWSLVVKSLMKMTIVEKLFSMKVKMEFILNIKTGTKNLLLEICGNVQMSLKSIINSL